MNTNEKADGPSNPKDEPILPAETITSASILKNAQEVWIDHNGELYRLRVTLKGKLILQK